MIGINLWVKQFHESRFFIRVNTYVLELVLIVFFLWQHLSILLFALLMFIIFLLYLRFLNIHIEFYAIRGITSILSMLMVEIACLLSVGNSTYWEFSKNIRIEYSAFNATVILLMIMTQLIVSVIYELWNARKNKDSFFYLSFSIKRVIEAVCCYKFMREVNFADSSIIYLCMFIISVILDYFLIFDVKKYKFIRQEEIRRIQIPANREAYYVKMEEEHLQIRSMFHDMKNQLMILEGDSNLMSGNTANFIEGFRDKMNKVGSFYHTGNSELDILLFECRRLALERHISFDVIFQEGCLSFMKQEDINAIFVNAIMNAIEACSKIENGEKSIKIQVGSRLNDVMIAVKNTKSSLVPSGKLKTSKKDKKRHGLGLLSIQRAADIYQGYVSITEDSQYFQLVILFVREE